MNYTEESSSDNETEEHGKSISVLRAAEIYYLATVEGDQPRMEE